MTVPKAGAESRQAEPVGLSRQEDDGRQQRSQGKSVLSLESDNIGFGSVVVGKSPTSKVREIIELFIV